MPIFPLAHAVLGCIAFAQVGSGAARAATLSQPAIIATAASPRPVPC